MDKYHGPSGFWDEAHILRQYQAKINAIPPLTDEEQADLIQTIQSGIAAQASLDASELTEEQRAKLEAQRHDGHLAENKMAEANLNLLLSIGKKYANHHPGTKLMDIIQEGYFGLRKAIQKFDPTKGVKFQTYAYWWIRESVGHAIPTQGPVIYIPEYTYKPLRHTLRYIQNNHDNPENNSDLSEKERHILLLMRPCSLDQPASGDTDALELGKILPDQHYLPIDQQLITVEFHSIISAALARLEPNCSYALTKYTGWPDGESQSIQEIGDYLGIKYEVARRRIKKAIKALTTDPQFMADMQEYIQDRTGIPNLRATNKQEN